MADTRRVVIVGGGFAGLACALKLASDPSVKVTLVDQHNYHQFQPLLYQVATSQLAGSDIAYPLRAVARKHPNIAVKLGSVTTIDPATRSVTTSTGEAYAGDYLALAVGSQPQFYATPGADEHTFPLYSLDDAQRLRSRILALFEEADRNPTVIADGALEFVVVGGGPTGVEIAGALAEMIQSTLASEFHELDVAQARVSLVDQSDVLLRMFSDGAHDYAAAVLQRDGVRLLLGTGVAEVSPDHATLSNGTVIRTRCVIWAAGLRAAPLVDVAGLPRSQGGRIDVQSDFTVDGFPGTYVIGDVANIPDPDGGTFPQLGSVAMQSGTWAGNNILRQIAGEAALPFKYRDKGTMAMIGRGAAIAVIPWGNHELHGPIAFAAWLGVHAALMSGFRNRINAFVDWGWDYFGSAGGPQILDRSDAARIDWDDDE